MDAETSARLKPTDTQRIQRALEIYRISGQPMSALLGMQKIVDLPYRVTAIALIPSDRAQLHARIESRFRDMLKLGLLDELRALKQKYALHSSLPAMRCVGYRQAWQFLEGEITEAELLDKGIAATRQLAKRQLTWLRTMPNDIELDCLEQNLPQRVTEICRKLLRSTESAQS